jgi:hypothetical protein
MPYSAADGLAAINALQRGWFQLAPPAAGSVSNGPCYSGAKTWMQPPQGPLLAVVAR